MLDSESVLSFVKIIVRVLVLFGSKPLVAPRFLFERIKGNGSEGAPAGGCKGLAAPCRYPETEPLVESGAKPQKHCKI